jgi:monothiol glutaredoxin
MTDSNTADEALDHLRALVASHDVVLFMKGTRLAPECGFSAATVEALDAYLETYETVNVLASPALRDGIKRLSDWPTIPQLYVRGQFIGGADIVAELRASGELGQLLGQESREQPPPVVTVTPRAAHALRAAQATATDESGADDSQLKLEITAQFVHNLFFGPRERGDIAAQTSTIAQPGAPEQHSATADSGDAAAKLSALVLLLDPTSARRAEGLRIDFVDAAGGGGFVLDNPNEPPRVRSLSVEQLAAMRERGDAFVLLDVRTPEELRIASIGFARPLDESGRALLDDLEPDTRVVFVCHHGVRSRAAAEHAIRSGLRNVWNLEGGIAAWSQRVDPSVPQY